MKKLLFALPLFAAVPLLAQSTVPAPPGAPDPARVTAGSYTVEGRHSQVVFSYKHFGLTENFGVLSSGTGSLTLDPKAPQNARLSVEMPINSIRTSIAALDTELQTSKFFDAAQFPTAKFESTSVQVNGQSADVVGNLTIKGITKPVTLKARFVAAGVNPFNKKETVAFEGSTTVKRSDFGLSFLVPLVGDDVTLKISVAFEKAV